jgi:type IV fimbrial biogenesis protein FimT
MKRNGFTLIELMVVVIIIGILGGLTVPSLVRNLPLRRLKDARAQMVGDLNLIRQLSMSRDLHYGLGVINSRQYRIFIDTSTPKNGTYDSGENIVKTTTLPASVSFNSTTFTIGFNPSGMVNNSSINPLIISLANGMVDTILIMQSGSIF